MIVDSDKKLGVGEEEGDEEEGEEGKTETEEEEEEETMALAAEEEAQEEAHESEEGLEREKRFDHAPGARRDQVSVAKGEKERGRETQGPRVEAEAGPGQGMQGMEGGRGIEKRQGVDGADGVRGARSLSKALTLLPSRLLHLESPMGCFLPTPSLSLSSVASRDSGLRSAEEGRGNRAGKGVAAARSGRKTSARAGSLEMLEAMMVDQERGWKQALAVCREEYQVHTNLLTQRLEEQEVRHRAELSLIQDQLRWSLEKEARLSARLETLTACRWERGGGGEGGIRGGGEGGEMQIPRTLAQSAQHSAEEVRRLERDVAILNEDLRSATEKNLLLANQVDLLRCAAEEAIDAAEARDSPRDTSLWPKSKRSGIAKEAAASPTATLNAVEQELISLQSLLETGRAQPRGERESLLGTAFHNGGQREMKRAQMAHERSPTPIPISHIKKRGVASTLHDAHELCTDAHELYHEAPASSAMHVQQLENALHKANKLLTDICQADAAWEQDIRSERERLRQGDFESPMQQVSVLELQRAEAKTAVMWGQVQELCAENRHLCDSLRFLQTQTVMERFHNLSTRLSPELRRAHGSHRDDAKVHYRGENEQLPGSSSDGVPAWKAAHGKETMMFPGPTDAAPDNQFTNGEFTEGIWIYRRTPCQHTKAEEGVNKGGGGGDFIQSKSSGGGGGGVSGVEVGARPRERGLDQEARAGGGIGHSGARLSSYTKYVVCKGACEK